jgi:hypothetical protein
LFFGTFEYNCCDSEPASDDTDDYTFRAYELLCGWERDLDFYSCGWVFVEPRQCDHAGYHSYDERFLYCTGDRRQWLYGYFCTYCRDGESRACSAIDYSCRSDDFLCGWQRDIEQQQPDQQYLDTRRCHDSIDFCNDERYVFCSSRQWWLRLCAIQYHYSHGQSCASYADDLGFWADDFLHRWVGDPYCASGDELFVEPRRGDDSGYHGER